MGYKKDFFGNPSRIGRFSPYRPSCHSPSSLPQTGRPHPAPSPSSSRSHPRPHAIVGARASAWPDRPCPLGRARPLASPLPKPPATTLPLPPTSPPSINGGNCRSHDWPPASPSPTLPLPLPSIKPATTEFSPPLSSSPSPSPSLPFSLARPPPPPRPCPCPGLVSDACPRLGHVPDHPCLSPDHTRPCLTVDRSLLDAVPPLPSFIDELLEHKN
jgi:hypothetical protein